MFLIKESLSLFLVFFKIGLFTFGGGYAMLALIEDICVEKKKWITHEEMMDIIVIAESTPGPLMVNMATYVGSTQGGILGALVATLAVVAETVTGKFRIINRLFSIIPTCR